MKHKYGVPQEEIDAASKVNLFDYLITTEPDAIKRASRTEYLLKEHDSLKIDIATGNWKRYSTGQKGNAIDFLKEFRGMSFKEAVKTLIGEEITAEMKKAVKPKIRSEPKDSFKLIQGNKNQDRVMAYLQMRGIDKEIIKNCINNLLLYESEKFHSVVFLGWDNDENGRNEPKFSSVRATKGNFKQDIAGSDKSYSWNMPPLNAENKDVLIVFESPIDAMAHASVEKVNPDSIDGHRLSLGGVESKALKSFLKRHPSIKQIDFCLDNDEAGKKAVNRMIEEIKGNSELNHLKLKTHLPPSGKDWGEHAKIVYDNFRNEKSKNKEVTNARIR